MELSIGQKISLFNQTTLDSLSLANTSEIVKNFTESGLKIVEANYAAAWYRVNDAGETYELAFSSPDLPFVPLRPSSSGLRNQVENNQAPYFVSSIPEEIIFKDLSPYIKSFVIVPIAHKNEIYGNMVFYFREAKNFSDEEKSLYTAFGHSAAQAITIYRLVKSEHQARIEAEKQGARFRALIENSYDAILLVDANSQIIDASKSVKRILGVDADLLLGRNISEFIYPDDLLTVAEHMQKKLLLPNTPMSMEFRYLHQDGSVRWMDTTGINLIDDPNVQGIVANIRDITERKQAEHTIQHQAMHDTLTDLPNRQEFAGRFSQALEAAKRNNGQMALMFLDMDRFKNINDQLGHSVGDTLLKVVASRLLTCLRNEDAVARFGGDEFLILLSEINSAKDAGYVAEKLLKAVTLPVKIGEHTLHPSVSIGIAVYPEDGQDMETLKRNADIALYRAKEDGRNRYCFYDHATDSLQTVERFTLENEFRQALAMNQIAVYYQPIINLKTRKLFAVEALARWQHPDKGLLLPADFITLAEDSGLIIKLDECVLSQVCGQIKVWQSLGLPRFRVAVNLSAQRFCEEDFIATVEKILIETGCEPSNLEFEITEGIAMSDLQLTTTNLKVLRKMGIHITIDDFGTGYSALSYLKRFAINNLKIDKSFIRNCITNPQDTSITRTITAMAHNLNLKVIAEGVESEAQLNFLASLGCNAAQGFYLGRPMPAEELLVWMSEKKEKPKIMAINF